MVLPSLTPEHVEFFRKKLSLASKLLLGVELTWYQAQMIDSTVDARFIMWICSRGIGKTWTGADYLIVNCILYNELRTCVYAKDFRYTLATFQKLEQIYETSPFLRAVTTSPPQIAKDRASLRFKNNSIIMAEPFKRGRRWNQILLDEAREIDIPDLSTVILPMLSDPHPVLPNKLIMASSSTYAGEPLHKLWEEFSDRVRAGDREYAVSSYNVYDALTSPYMDKTIVDKSREIMLKDEFEIEYENQWVNLAGGWIKGWLIRACERAYSPELFGEIGYDYAIGIDFGRAIGGDATSITVVKIIPNLGCRIVRNITAVGMPIPDQSTLIRQVHKDFGGKNRGNIIGIALDFEKLGYAVCDMLRLEALDPRDGLPLIPLVSVEDTEISNAIRILKQVNFADKVGVYIMACKMKKGFEAGTLTLPKDNMRFMVTDAEKENLNVTDREMVSACEEIALLKREICNVEVISNSIGNSLSFKRSSARGEKKDRFTSAFLACAEAIDYYEEISTGDSGDFVGMWGAPKAVQSIYKQK